MDFRSWAPGRFFAVLSFVLATVNGTAFGSGMGEYFRNYNLGINLIGSNDQISVGYQVRDDVPKSGSCYPDTDGTMRCWEHLNEPGGGIGSEYLRGFGVFIQQPLKRQGFWYFSADVAFGAMAFSGGLPPKRTNSSLRGMTYSLYGIRVKPYLQFGITPQEWLPDILISMGPVADVMAGQVSVNNDRRNSVLIQTSRLFAGFNPLAYAYFELEVIFWRFGDGAFSLYASQARTDDRKAGGSFYPGEKDGMYDFHAKFNSSEAGMKFLMNWPD